MLKIIKPAIISYCFFSALASATESENTSGEEIKYSSPTVLQVEQIQAETVIYEAKLARQKAVSELRNLDLNGVTGSTAAIHSPPGPSLPDADVSLTQAISKAMRVTEIWGTPEQMSARITLPDGSVADVSAGQQLPGTPYSVESVTREGVWLRNGTEKRQLIL
ncbi:type IV pilus biogenesis protein PilP [Salmonella enterica subsp. enterica serovar 4,[5],12:b:-]|nr:type IV pilus biogenesis protein PilP [Salmonella enterica subsp. enterica serovar 4,[5],12:b:-]